ncbi:MAG: hypothetical protein ABFS16_09855 [Bacteroidota bacterium]
MKNQIRILGIIVTVLFSTNFSIGQVKIGGIDQYMDYSNISKNISGPNNEYSDMKGSPFLNEEFQTGRVKLRNGKIYEGPLRYDIYSDQIEFQTKDGAVYEIMNPETVEKVSIGENTFLYFEKEEDRLLDGIYEELANGKYTLLAKHRVYLKDAVPAKPYIEPKPATFVKKNSDYLVIDSKGEVIIIKNKKDLTALAEDTSDIQSFLKKNKIKVNKEEDLIAVVNYLNKE